MKEVTSSYDDIEKRMAIFLGLGALIFSSLYLFAQGADLYTYLVRGVLALALFTVVGWAYGHWLKGVIRKQEDDERQKSAAFALRNDDDEGAHDNAQVQASENSEAVIPAEHSSGKTVDFTLPELEPFAEPVQPPRAGI